jgi:hypothetical protein
MQRGYRCSIQVVQRVSAPLPLDGFVELVGSRPKLGANPLPQFRCRSLAKGDRSELL